MLIEVLDGSGTQGGIGKRHFQEQQGPLGMIIASPQLFLCDRACQRPHAGCLAECLELQQAVFQILEVVRDGAPRNV